MGGGWWVICGGRWQDNGGWFGWFLIGVLLIKNYDHGYGRNVGLGNNTASMEVGRKG